MRWPIMPLPPITAILSGWAGAAEPPGEIVSSRPAARIAGSCVHPQFMTPPPLLPSSFILEIRHGTPDAMITGLTLSQLTGLSTLLDSTSSMKDRALKEQAATVAPDINLRIARRVRQLRSELGMT